MAAAPSQLCQKANALSRDIARALDAMALRGRSRPVVSTMTMTAKLNTEKVCRMSLETALHVQEGLGPLKTATKRRGARQRVKSTQPDFYNQLTMSHGSRSIKVFKNGSLHVTGCKTVAQFMEVATSVGEMMADVADIKPTDGTESLRVTDFDVQLVNIVFSAGRELYLRELRDAFTALGHAATYDPDSYPGLNVKLPVGDRLVTALIFKSGKVIITGGKSALEIETAHRMILDAVPPAP